MLTDPRDDEDFLDEMLDLAVELLSSGGRPDPRALCAARPHLITSFESAVAAVEDALGRAPRFPGVPGYDIVGRLGCGGMGTVFLAHDIAAERLVALKVMSGPWSPNGRARFLAEARAMRSISHSHVVAVFGSNESQDHLSYAMQWVDGWNLGELMRHLRARRDGEVGAGDDAVTALPYANDLTRSICEIGAAIARALDHVHASGLLHRDVKPGNILIDRTGKPWLSDFGLVRDVADDTRTQTGAFVGTTAYAAPEQLRGDRDQLSPSTDVFSLGVTLYEGLTGVLPFAGEPAAAILRRIELGSCVPARTLVRGLSHNLQTIVHKAIEAEPAHRYATAGALAEDLERLLARRPILARPPTVPRSIRKWMRSRPLVAAGLGLVLLGLPLGTATAVYAVPRLRLARGIEEQAEASRMVEQGWLAIDETRSGDAETMLGRAIELRPDDSMALAGLVTALADQRQFQRAISMLDNHPVAAADLHRVRVRLEAKLADAERAAQLVRDLPPARTALDFLLDANDELRRGSDKDREPYRRALEMVEESMTRSPVPLLRAHDVRCQAAAGSRDRERTERALAALALLFPQSASAWFRAGRTWQILGVPLRAAEAYRACVDLSPTMAFARNNLANCLVDLGHLDEAEVELRAALAVDPSYAAAHYNLGNVLLKRERWSAAEVEFKAAIASDPALRSALLNLGCALIGARRFDAALEALHAYAENIDSPRALHAIGVAFAGKGDPLRAAENYRACAGSPRADLLFVTQAGRGLIALGLIEEGIAMLERASELTDGTEQQRQETARLLAAATDVHATQALLTHPGAMPPDAAARLMAAVHAASLDLFATAATLARSAFAVDPGVTSTPFSEHRVAAAEWALRSAGADCPEGLGLSAPQRAEWLSQATIWLHEAIASLTVESGGNDSAPRILVRVAQWESSSGPTLLRASAKALPEVMTAEMPAAREAVARLRRAVDAH